MNATSNADVDPYPRKLERLADRRLLIEWSDGQRRAYTARELQENCPCAHCRENRRQPAPPAPSLLPVLDTAQARPLEITRMAPVGNYAYHIDFNHGCGSGIYSIERLRDLGAVVR
ncbi:MAG: DUF971 domain-containing protein [Planctomycetes bacterium]|nr:DUF971 domain-containing protein [Planctomycetota bacterium]